MRAALVLVVVAAACAHKPSEAERAANDARMAKVWKVRRVALVQYAINPHTLLGTPQAPESKAETAARAWGIFYANTQPALAVMPFTEMAQHPAYTSLGRESLGDYYTAPGGRFFSTNAEELEDARIPPGVAYQLTQGLGVDAVAVIYDSWGIDPHSANQTPFGPHFTVRAYVHNDYKLKLFDSQGEQLWMEWRNAESEESLGYAEGFVTTDVGTFATRNGEAFQKVVSTFAANWQKWQRKAPITFPAARAPATGSPPPTP